MGGFGRRSAARYKLLGSAAFVVARPSALAKGRPKQLGLAFPLIPYIVPWQKAASTTLCQVLSF